MDHSLVVSSVLESLVAESFVDAVITGCSIVCGWNAVLLKHWFVDPRLVEPRMMGTRTLL